MIDIWRLKHPNRQGLLIHKSYTRIDYFVMDAKLISNIVQTKYRNTLISNHSPISLKLMLSLPKQTYCWHFNPWLLTDQVFIDYMSARLGEFYETNDTGDLSDLTLWETLKIVMRGHIISFEASKKREQRRHVVEIENALPTLEESNRDSR